MSSTPVSTGELDQFDQLDTLTDVSCVEVTLDYAPVSTSDFSSFLLKASVYG